MRHSQLLAGLLAFSFTFVGCGPQGNAPGRQVGYGSESAPSAARPPEERRTSREAPVGYGWESPSTGIRNPRELESRTGGNDVKSARINFLHRLREADPQFQTIERAVINEQNELGIVLSRTVEMDDVPRLMRSMLKQMAAEFPGEDITVVAYAPSNPPMKIGTGRLDARSREMTYVPARR
jgi:hypothetical protein